MLYIQKMMKSKFKPGDKVIVGDDVPGVIERVIYARNSVKPHYLVEWWDRSEVRAREFYEEEINRE